MARRWRRTVRHHRRVVERPRSDLDQRQRAVESPEISRVTRNHWLPRASRTHHDMCVRDVRCPSGREETARGRRPWPIQVHQVRTRLAHEPSESDLARRVANGLRKGRCRDRDRHTSLSAARNQRDDTSVVAVERDERSGVEGDTAHLTPSLSVTPTSRPARVRRRPTPAPPQ